MMSVGRKLDRFMEHVKEGESFALRHMVNILIHFTEDPTHDVELNRNSLKAFSQDLIAGGTENSCFRSLPR